MMCKKEMCRRDLTSRPSGLSFAFLRLICSFGVLSGVLFGASPAEAGLKIYYIRHAEGGHNVKKAWEEKGIPESEWPAYVGNPNIFTPLGLEQQAAVSAKLKKYDKFDFIASSPMWRCRNTIIPYMKEVGAKGEIWAELSEQPANARILKTDLPEPLVPILGAGGKVELPADELEYFSICEDATHRFIINRADTGPGAADRSAAAARMVIQNVLDRVQERFGGTDKSILFAGHGSSGKAVLRMLTQKPLNELAGISNTGIWMVEEQPDGTFELKLFNDEPVVNGRPVTTKPSKYALMDSNKDGQVTKAEYIAFYVAGFERKDKNRDGVISPNEHRHSSFTAADHNKDDQLTQKEFSTIYEKQFDNTYDKNGTGRIAVGEMEHR